MERGINRSLLEQIIKNIKQNEGKIRSIKEDKVISIRFFFNGEVHKKPNWLNSFEILENDKGYTPQIEKIQINQYLCFCNYLRMKEENDKNQSIEKYILDDNLTFLYNKFQAIIYALVTKLMYEYDIKQTTNLLETNEYVGDVYIRGQKLNEYVVEIVINSPNISQVKLYNKIKNVVKNM